MIKPRQIEITKEQVRLVDPFFEKNEVSFYVETWFDVDKYFGVELKDDDEWINFYVAYSNNKITACYVLNGFKSSDEYSWELTDEEQKMFKELMEEYSQKVFKCGIDEIIEKENSL